MATSRRSFLIGIGAVAGAAVGLGVSRVFGTTDSTPSTTNAEAIVTTEPGVTTAGVPNSTSATSTSVPTPTTNPATTAAPTTTEATTTTVADIETTTAAPGTAAALTLICKSSWGANPLAGQLQAHSIERLTVHHTAVVLAANSQAPARARQHQQFHQDSGWADLAYHYLVDANGHIYEGRPFSAPGDTFTSYDPSGHFLVCCEGHFDEQEIPAAQLEALAGMLAWGAIQFGVSPDTIGGHRDYASTTCPGTSLYGNIADGTLQALVESFVDGGVELITVCDDTGDALVAAIEAGTA